VLIASLPLSIVYLCVTAGSPARAVPEAYILDNDIVPSERAQQNILAKADFVLEKLSIMCEYCIMTVLYEYSSITL